MIKKIIHKEISDRIKEISTCEPVYLKILSKMIVDTIEQSLNDFSTEKKNELIADVENLCAQTIDLDKVHEGNEDWILLYSACLKRLNSYR